MYGKTNVSLIYLLSIGYKNKLMVNVIYYESQTCLEQFWNKEVLLICLISYHLLAIGQCIVLSSFKK